MTQELRKLADAADSAMTYDWEWIEFKQACAPEAILALLDRLEKAEKDAERYRWLRSPDTDPSLVIDKRTGWVPPDEHVEGVTYEYRAGEELDTAIDGAMEASK